MNTDDRPTELTLSPPFVAAPQFEEFTVFLRALGYQIVAVHPSPDGFGGEVVVKTEALFCPCCAVTISLAQMLDEGKCDRCQGENCISEDGKIPVGHARFASLFLGGPLKGRIVTDSVEPLLFPDFNAYLASLPQNVGDW